LGPKKTRYDLPQVGGERGVLTLGGSQVIGHDGDNGRLQRYDHAAHEGFPMSTATPRLQGISHRDMGPAELGGPQSGMALGSFERDREMRRSYRDTRASEKCHFELPLVDTLNDAHGILVLGGSSAGKTSLILSMSAMLSGSYPVELRKADKKGGRGLAEQGQSYEFPERDVKLSGGSLKSMRVVLTDTPAAGVSKEEQPLCTQISPNSTQHFNAIPSWMRITLRSGNFPHYAVLCVVDSLAPPLWEDHRRCRDLARLLSVLKRNQYTVVVAVTKLLKARQLALREVAHTGKNDGTVGKDPRSSYESYVGRYMDKTCAAIQAKAGENEWSFSHGPDAPPFPLVNVTMFDVPTWASNLDFKEWQDRKGTPELPNLRYMNTQLQRLLTALSVRSHPE